MTRYKISGRANHTLVVGDMSEQDITGPGTLILDPNWEDWGNLKIEESECFDNILAFTSPEFVSDAIKTVGWPTHLFAWDCRSALPNPKKNYPMMRLKLCLWVGHRFSFSVDRSRYVLPGSGKYVGKGKRLQELFDEPGHSISNVVERAGHPYAKPVPWVKSLISSVHIGGSVVDLFAGSGTTLFCCDDIGVDSQLVEINEKYAQLIINKCKQKGMEVEND